MADIPVQDTEDLAGGTPTFQFGDPAGDSFENDGLSIMRVFGPISGFTVRFANGRDCNFEDHEPYDVVSASGQQMAESPRLAPRRFNVNGRVAVSYLDSGGNPSAVGIRVQVLRHHIQLKDA